MHKRFFLFVAVFLGAAGAVASAQTLPDPNLVLVPFHASNIYRIGERAGWNIHALLGAGYTRYSYELSENNLKVIQSGEIDLSSGLGTVSTTLGSSRHVVSETALYRRPSTRHVRRPARTGQDDGGRGGRAGTDQAADRQARGFRCLLGRQVGGAEARAGQSADRVHGQRPRAGLRSPPSRSTA